MLLCEMNLNMHTIPWMMQCARALSYMCVICQRKEDNEKETWWWSKVAWEAQNQGIINHLKSTQRRSPMGGRGALQEWKLWLHFKKQQ